MNRGLKVIFAMLLLAMVGYETFASYPSYNTEGDCRSCHGTVVDRHHLLVVNGTYGCMDCHPVKYDNISQSYYTEVIRNCLTCHPNKNHTDTHHLLVQQGLFVCTDCHPIKYDAQNQTYYPEITWDCTVCHSTVISPNATPTPTPTPEPTPTPPVPPTVIALSPVSPVNDIAGNSRNFGITTDQIVNITWFIDNTQVQVNESVMDASYTNTSAVLGIWNVSAVASNINGSVEYTWRWNVTAIISYPPVITSCAPYSPVNDSVGTSRKFGITIDQIANITWFINGSQVQFNESVMGASYTNTSASPGIWYVNASAINANGSVMNTWIWNVTPAPEPNTPPGLHAPIACSICHAQPITEQTCYQCHNNSSNSYNGINVYDEFHAGNSTYAGMGVTKGYYNKVNTRHDISDADQNYSSTRLECTDCHSAHIASRENILIDPDNNRTPFNKTMIHPGTGETVPDAITFCLKCHDNTWTPNGTVVGPSVIKNITSVFMNSSPKADEHGIGSGSNNSILIGPYASRNRSYNVPPMPCTDCHDSHGGGGIYHLKTLTDQNGVPVTITSQNVDDHIVAHWCSHCHYNPMNQLDGTKDRCLSSACHIHGSKF